LESKGFVAGLETALDRILGSCKPDPSPAGKGNRYAVSHIQGV
jgi:hypothetical protein